MGGDGCRDGGATWSPPTHLAGPIRLDWLAATSQGRMVGDYISTSFAGRRALPLFAQAERILVVSGSVRSLSGGVERLLELGNRSGAGPALRTPSDRPTMGPSRWLSNFAPPWASRKSSNARLRWTAQATSTPEAGATPCVWRPRTPRAECFTPGVPVAYSELCFARWLQSVSGSTERTRTREPAHARARVVWGRTRRPDRFARVVVAVARPAEMPSSG